MEIVQSEGGAGICTCHPTKRFNRLDHDTDVAFHVVENRAAREIGQGVCLSAIAPQRPGRRQAYRSVMTTEQCPGISFSFSMDSPDSTRFDAKVWRVAGYQRRPGRVRQRWSSASRR